MLLRIGEYSQNLGVVANGAGLGAENTFTLGCYIIFIYLIIIPISKKLVSYSKCSLPLSLKSLVFPSFAPAVSVGLLNGAYSPQLWLHSGKPNQGIIVRTSV